MRLAHSEYDPETGITEEWWLHTDGSNRLTIRRLQDVEATLDLNKAEYNHHGNIGYGDVQGGAFKVARIPLMVIEKWMREYGFNWFQSTDKERRAMLNKPENRYLLTRPGKL